MNFIKDGLTTKTYQDLDSLAKDIDEPSLKQSEVDELLKQINGSSLTEHKYVKKGCKNKF